MGQCTRKFFAAYTGTFAVELRTADSRALLLRALVNKVAYHVAAVCRLRF